MADTYDTINIFWDEEGRPYLEKGVEPPDMVSWSPELLMMLEAGCEQEWCTLYDGVISMQLVGGPLRYRLTGDHDATGHGLTAERVRGE